MSLSVEYSKTGELSPPWFYYLDDPSLRVRHDRDFDDPDNIQFELVAPPLRYGAAVMSANVHRTT